jgi:hypothetical protein
MGGFIDDCLDVLRFSFSWISDNSVYSLLGILALFAFIQSVLSLGLQAVMGSLPVMFALLLLYFAISLVVYYFSVKVILYSLKKKNFGNIEYGVLPYLKVIVLSIFTTVSTVIPWMDFKLIAAEIAAVVILVAFAILVVLAKSTLTAGLFLMALGFAMTVIGIIAIYASIRLLPATYLFLAGKADIVDSVRKSWVMTKGKFWKIFGTMFCTGIVLLIGYIGIMILFVIATMISGKVDSVAFNSKGGPLTTLFEVIFKTLTIPAFTFVSMYMMVGIYALVDSPSGFGSPQQEVPNKPEPSPSPLPEPDEKKLSPVLVQKQTSPKPAKKSAPKQQAKKPEKKKTRKR